MRIVIYINYECNVIRFIFVGKFKLLNVFIIYWEKIMKNGYKVRNLKNIYYLILGKVEKRNNYKGRNILNI